MPWDPRCANKLCNKKVTREQAAAQGTWLEAHINIRPLNSGLNPKKYITCGPLCMAQILLNKAQGFLEEAQENEHDD